MMPIEFPQQNYIISGGDNHIDVPAYKDGMRLVSCWRLNKEELDKIVSTGVIWLHVVGSMPHMAMSGFDPFKKLKPLVVDERIAGSTILSLIEDEEIIFVRINDNEKNFKVMYDGTWYNLHYQLSDDIDKRWRSSVYAFKDEVEVIGHAHDCPEFWWVLPQFGLSKHTTLILKRNNLA